jgi:hypothetical protein
MIALQHWLRNNITKWNYFYPKYWVDMSTSYHYKGTRLLLKWHADIVMLLIHIYHDFFINGAIDGMKKNIISPFYVIRRSFSYTFI